MSFEKEKWKTERWDKSTLNSARRSSPVADDSARTRHKSKEQERKEQFETINRNLLFSVLPTLNLGKIKFIIYETTCARWTVNVLQRKKCSARPDTSLHRYVCALEIPIQNLAKFPILHFISTSATWLSFHCFQSNSAPIRTKRNQIKKLSSFCGCECIELTDGIGRIALKKLPGCTGSKIFWTFIVLRIKSRGSWAW